MKKVIIICNLLLILFSIGLHYYLYNYTQKTNLENYRNKMETLIEIPYSLAESFEKNHRANPIVNKNIIQEEFINIVNQFSFDKNDYFFIIDGKGNMISNPLRPSLSWWNMQNETDVQGKFLFKELINISKRDGKGFIETEWESKYNEDISENQIIYGKYFWPWDWIICTTLYTNEMTFTQPILDMTVIIYICVFFILFNVTLFLLFRGFGNTKKHDVV